MNLVEWLIKEMTNISLQLGIYLGYYRLRDKLPFFTCKHQTVKDRHEVLGCNIDGELPELDRE